MSAPADDAFIAAVEGIRRATQQLIGAAEVGDAETIGAAIEARGRWIAQLRDRFRDGGDAAGAEALGRELAQSLSLQAHEAEAGLVRLQQRARAGLERLVEGTRVVEGYAAYPLDPSALDRSG